MLCRSVIQSDMTVSEKIGLGVTCTKHCNRGRGVRAVVWYATLKPGFGGPWFGNGGDKRVGEDEEPVTTGQGQCSFAETLSHA